MISALAAGGATRDIRRRSSGPRPGGGMADTKVLEAFAVRRAGSSPVPGTNYRGSDKLGNGKGANTPAEA